MMDWNENLIQKRMEAFGNSAASLNSCRFDRDNGSVSALQHARNYADNWSSVRMNNIGLLLWGPPGTGKTFAAGCIANALLEMPGFHSPTVMMVTFGTVLRLLLAKSPLEKEEYFQKLMGCSLLILDDFGMERQTEYAREQVFNIIDGRCQIKRPMVITTNLTLQQLRSPQDLEQQRIYDRILGVCVPVCFQGDSMRSSLGAEKMQLFRKITEQTAPQNRLLP